MDTGHEGHALKSRDGTNGGDGGEPGLRADGQVPSMPVRVNNIYFDQCRNHPAKEFSNSNWSLRHMSKKSKADVS